MLVVRQSPWVGRCLIAMAAASSMAALAFAYASGCAGDLKSGVWGDAQRAMQFDGDFGLSLILMLSFGACAVAVQRSTGRNPLIGAAVVGATVFLTWALGWQFGSWGSDSCYPH